MIHQSQVRWSRKIELSLTNGICIFHFTVNFFPIWFFFLKCTFNIVIIGKTSVCNIKSRIMGSIVNPITKLWLRDTSGLWVIELNRISQVWKLSNYISRNKIELCQCNVIVWLTHFHFSSSNSVLHICSISWIVEFLIIYFFLNNFGSRVNNANHTLTFEYVGLRKKEIWLI